MGILDIGAGAAGGLESLLTRMRAEDQLALQQRAQSERERAAYEEEAFRRQSLEETAGLRRLQAEQLGEDRAARQAAAIEAAKDRDRARILSSIPMRPIGGYVTPEERARETEASAPSAIYGAEETPYPQDFVGPIPPGQPERGMSVFPFKGTQAAQEQAARTAQGEARLTQAEERMRQMAEQFAQREGRLEGAAAARAEAKQTLSPTSEANIVNRLSSQWTKASEPKRQMDRQVALMDAGMEAARRGDRGAGYQVVLVTFQKILDPPSVVRESEYMRSASGQSLQNRVRGFVEQLAQGGASMPISELEKFARLAREAAQAQDTGYLNSVRSRLKRTADRYSIPEELVFEETPESPVGPSEGVNVGSPPLPAAGPVAVPAEGKKKGRYNPATGAIEY